MTKGTMRSNFKWAMILVTIVIIAIAYHIAFTDNVDYQGIAYLIGALGVFIAPFVTGKWGEKREETKIEIK